MSELILLLLLKNCSSLNPLLSVEVEAEEETDEDREDEDLVMDILLIAPENDLLWCPTTPPPPLPPFSSKPPLLRVFNITCWVSCLLAAPFGICPKGFFLAAFTCLFEDSLAFIIDPSLKFLEEAAAAQVSVEQAVLLNKDLR